MLIVSDGLLPSARTHIAFNGHTNMSEWATSDVKEKGTWVNAVAALTYAPGLLYTTTRNAAYVLEEHIGPSSEIGVFVRLTEATRAFTKSFFSERTIRAGQ